MEFTTDKELYRSIYRMNGDVLNDCFEDFESLVRAYMYEGISNTCHKAFIDKVSLFRFEKFEDIFLEHLQMYFKRYPSTELGRRNNILKTYFRRFVCRRYYYRMVASVAVDCGKEYKCNIIVKSRGGRIYIQKYIE